MTAQARGLAANGSPPEANGRLVAFLRAINVGGHTVKMDRLRALFEAMGFSDVATFIASGNVIFSTDLDTLFEASIERHLFDALGYEVTAFVRPLPRLAAIVAHDPFAGGRQKPGGTMYIGFLKAPPPDSARDALASLNSDTDRFALRDRELYWLCKTRFSDSPVSGGMLERTLDTPLTIRNANTLHRIVKKFVAR
jgi:uncharacterized protein (DUF1697 family)